jgi:FkbM family methyltransferase
MRKIAKNWIDVALFRIGLKKTLTIKFRDGETAYFENRAAYFDFWNQELGQNELLKTVKNIHYKIKGNNIELEYQNRKIYFYYDTNKQLSNTIGLINENFTEGQYKWLDVKGKDVVDVGANIGDSAIYFALRGAKHVYAFEPYPYSYNIAKKNIKLNHLEDRITLLNEGCGRSRFVTIKEDYNNTGSTDLKSFKEGKKIRIESLDEIVKKFNLKHAALKIDCEGCEYALILNTSDKTLHAFDQIIMEYHYGYRNLVKRLRQAGFKVKYSLPKYNHNIEAEDSNMYAGFIFCRKYK